MYTSDYINAHFFELFWIILVNDKQLAYPSYHYFLIFNLLTPTVACIVFHNVKTYQNKTKIRQIFHGVRRYLSTWLYV